jgi:secreted PhoX family phosphatase
VQNNEYTDDVLLFPDGTANWNQEKTNKSLNAHGVAIVEIRRTGRLLSGGDWEVVRPSPYARRITGMTPIRMGGPVAQYGEATADPRLITSADPTGREVLGTVNNCAMGFTPWQTYLTCEENFNGYFVRDRPGAQRAEQVRLGRRNRSLRPRLDSGETHRPRAPETRGRVGTGSSRRARRRLHGRR